jgi:hypothetical protein
LLPEVDGVTVNNLLRSLDAANLISKSTEGAL